MKKYLIAGSLGTVVMLASCKKDDSTENTNSAIEGNYKLKYCTSQTNSTVTSTDGEKTVTTTDYTTINNQGTITFNNSTR